MIMEEIFKKKDICSDIDWRARKRGPPGGGRPGWFFQTKLEAATL